jgi:hypothetical protein
MNALSIGLDVLEIAGEIKVINSHSDRPHTISDAQMSFLAAALRASASGRPEGSPASPLASWREGFGAGLRCAHAHSQGSQDQ